MCFYCNCKTTNSNLTTHVVTLEKCVIVIKNVPCEECEQCGEQYFSDEVMEKLEGLVEKAKEISSEFVVTDFGNKVA